jgi:hypothetical protein
MPNKTHGSPYKMKAGKMGPMQKNFGPELAINKKLDKNSMAGGLTGQPSGETGKLGHGPIMKKKGGQTPTPTVTKVKTPKVKKSIFKKPTPEQQAKRDKLKNDVKSFGKGLKKAGSDVNKKLQKAGKYMSAKSIKSRKVKKDSKIAANKKPNAVFNNAKTEQNLKKPTKLKVNKKLMDKKVNTNKKIDHNKGLKGKTGQARTDYYNKHKLKHDDTITTKKK